MGLLEACGARGWIQAAFVGWSLVACANASAADAARAASPAKTLRYATSTAEGSLDPAKVSDLYSRTLTAHIFEALYTYDPLARPVKIKPLTASALAEHSDDYRVWTVKVRPGIYFADDPAFKGRRRELVATDYVYAFKRFADPKNNSPAWGMFADMRFVGLVASRQRSIDSGRAFDYDSEIEGIRALDRFTLRFSFEEPRPRFQSDLAANDLLGAVAREVVEHYGPAIDEHPVGTGPFRLAQWRRSSLIVFERNPSYRRRLYEAEPLPQDEEGQAILSRLKGRSLPLIDRVEVSIVPEQQSRWLSFAGGESDVILGLGHEFLKLALPDGALAADLARRSVGVHRELEPGVSYMMFNMEDATVGGYSPEKVALRRAVGLGMNIGKEIDVLWFGNAVQAQSPLVPHTTGYATSLRSEFGSFDPARANALLDLHGFRDRDGDGWRDMPDGSPLTLTLASQSDTRARSRDELFVRDMEALRLRAKVQVGLFQENLKAARAGVLSMWTLGHLAASSDGQGPLLGFSSQNIGGHNLARFKLPAFDALLERMAKLQDGPERDALFAHATRLAVAYMPYKYRVNRVLVDLSQPWIVGYRRPIFWLDWWQYVDIDESRRVIP